MMKQSELKAKLKTPHLPHFPAGIVCTVRGVMSKGHFILRHPFNSRRIILVEPKDTELYLVLPDGEILETLETK